MPITITNTLTGQRWVYSDEYVQTNGSLNLSAPPFTPGLYDIRNSSDTLLAVFQNGARSVGVPDADTLLGHLPHSWSVSNNENLYSRIQVDGDYIGWMSPSAARGMKHVGGAVPLLQAFGVIPEPPP